MADPPRTLPSSFQSLVGARIDGALVAVSRCSQRQSCCVCLAWLEADCGSGVLIWPVLLLARSKGSLILRGQRPSTARRDKTSRYPNHVVKTLSQVLLSRSRVLLRCTQAYRLSAATMASSPCYLSALYDPRYVV